MSNEELVAAIQGGSTERMGELWEQVEKLVKWKANRIITALSLKNNPCGVELDDLMQSGYVAMVAAANTYNAENGKFSTWLMYHLQKEFADITGYRTKQGRHDPLNLPYGMVAELDKPMGDDANSDPLSEIIPDSYAEAQMKAVEECYTVNSSTMLWNRLWQKFRQIVRKYCGNGFSRARPLQKSERAEEQPQRIYGKWNGTQSGICESPKASVI